MKNVVRVFLTVVLLFPVLCSIGCGGSNEPVVATEGMTDAEIQAYQDEIDASYAREDDEDSVYVTD